MLRFLLGGLAAAALALPSAASAAGPTPEQALADLNAWRAETGLAPVTGLDPELSEGCRLHNAYAQRNGSRGHFEDPELPGYTELGHRAAASSVLAYGREEGPRGWLDAVYHRTSLLKPRLRTTWFDASSGGSCMGVFGVTDDPSARAPGLTLHPWPPHDARGVELEFRANESPNPYDAVPAGVTQLGFLLSVNVNGPWRYESGSTLTAASLTPDGGAPLAVSGQDARSPGGGSLDGGFGIFPHAPLTERTWYTAHATGYVTGYLDDASEPVQYPFDLSWRFQTRGRDPRTSATADSGIVTVSTESAAPVQVTVRRGGEVIATRALADRGRWMPAVPAGGYELCAAQAEQGLYDGYANCAPVDIPARTRLSLSGKLSKAGVLSVVVGSSQVVRGRWQTVIARRPVTRCTRKAGKRRCSTTWKQLHRTGNAARKKVTYRFSVPAPAKKVRVTVTEEAPGGTTATATRTFTRR